MYAVGKIPGGFNKREGKASEHAILTSRVIDRPMRPLFPKDYRNDVTLNNMVMAVDTECNPEVVAMLGSSIATCISDIPFDGPCAATQMGMVNGELVVNPSLAQKEISDLQLTVASTREKVIMIEAGANEIPEAKMIEAIFKAHEVNQEIIAFIDKIVAECGKEKHTYESCAVPEELFAAIKEIVTPEEMEVAVFSDDKQTREENIRAVTEKLEEAFAENEEWLAVLPEAVYQYQKKTVRKMILKDHKRPDGRAITQIRPLAAEVDLIPRVHGSAMFTRGQTQICTVTTLAPLSEAQRLDGLDEFEVSKRYMHHYNFPSYSVGETKPSRGPGRREIGHGALAERALLPVIPPVEEFPYAYRLVSEVVSSNGSTSQASICGSTLALMDAGVPIKAPVAGISCGLITEGERWMTMVDIQGLEDFFGDMDFKVAGTHEGITAIQMDLKIDGLTPEIVKEALEKTHKARDYILDEIILKCIPAPRAELSKYAPKMLSITIPVDKIREVIGSGGKVIQKICAECDVKVDVEEDGSVFISGTDIDNCNRALTIVKTIVEDPEVGAIYKGRVTRLMDFGAFVEIAPGKEGLVHISRLDVKRTEKVTDVVNVDDEVLVKVLEIDDKGRLNLSRRDALIEVEGLTPENEISDAPRRPRRDDRRGSNGFRPNNNRPRN